MSTGSVSSSTYNNDKSSIPPPKEAGPLRFGVKLLALGAPSVGKTALLEKFAQRKFKTGHIGTPNFRETFTCTVVLNDKLYELRCTDIPAVLSFPQDSLAEWESECRGHGIRSAAAYILVYDASRPLETFAIVENLYKQLRCYRPNAPCVVVAAKYDLIDQNPKTMACIERMEQLVQSTWNSPHVQCSAKHNWHVNMVFQELVALLDVTNNDEVVTVDSNKENDLSTTEEKTDPKKCVIM